MITTHGIERDELIHEFWDSVRTTLLEQYRRPADIADRYIKVYRKELDRRMIGDLVYNQGIEKTADVVNGIIENGLINPDAA